ncbi:MAG: phosphoribosyltransferase [Spirulina sp. SIO3F2]|nr:phosphoribosyltransferase [Spirulina sp. SIO3F2]
MADLYVSWADYHRKIEQLAVLVHHSHWQFNQIVCIAKGGLRIGDLLCRLYDVPLAILSAASYGGQDNRVRGQIQFSEHLAMTTATLGDRILLVDDLVDSGISLHESRQWLQKRYGAEIQEIRTAVLWYKHCSFIEPDYYVDYLADDPWIHQPFEWYEQSGPGELAERILGERDELVQSSGFKVQSSEVS